MSYLYQYIQTPSHPYRMQDLNVFFSGLNCLEIIKAVLDEAGNIKNFPGITKDERWEKKHRLGQCYDVRFEAEFHALEQERFLMLWTIQPSGWHWMDSDGFGFSGDSHIMLYSIIDKQGAFEKPFELFSIDQTRYCHEFDHYLLY
ncbi:MAG: hypothetical protein J6A26_02755 [Oscillospiraceae bacterium]|nr:hypothetical protein [Oscillospiraceae bacterium]